MDEHNPKMHLCFVPLTADKRLSAKEVIGSRDKLVQWQDKFHDYMLEEFPELERGQAAAVTKRKHVPTWMYKQAHQLADELQDCRDFIDSIPQDVFEELKRRYEMQLQGAEEGQ